MSEVATDSCKDELQSVEALKLGGIQISLAVWNVFAESTRQSGGFA